MAGAGIAFQPILCYLLNSKSQTLNGARGVHLCLGSYIAILIFLSSVVTNDYIDVAIKEMQVFNQNPIPFKYDVCGLVRFMLLKCFINDDEKENI